MTAGPATGSRELLQQQYDEARARLRQVLLDGQPWEALEALRRQVTELEIALDLNGAPKRSLRFRRGR